jgi:predicted F0F1-ATPase subunit
VKQRGEEGDQRNREQEGRGLWQTMAVATSLAWNLVVPIVGGAMLGRAIDDRVGEEYMWTVTLLFGGTFIAFYNLYQMLFKES